MENLFVEVMKMKNRDKTILQKLKDNAFYVALGLGLLAIPAVVAVYTIERDGGQLASNDVDLNKASDYSVITTEENQVEETNAKTANQSGSEERNTLKEDLTTEEKTEEVTEASTEEQTSDTANAAATETERDYPLPVTADTGELNFTSDKTLTWPVNGEVILPDRKSVV